MLLPSDERPPGAPARYTLKFPSTWSHFDLDPSTRDASIRRRIEEQAKGHAKLTRDQVDSLVREARKAAREAHAQGALQVCGLLTFLADGSTLNATTMVMRTRIPEDQSADLVEQMTAAGVANNRRSPGRGTDANRVEIVELPEVGSAGRMTSIEDFDYFGKATVRTAVHQIVIPVPSSRDLIVIGSSTPNISLSENFFNVFDAIATTFRFHDEEVPDGVGPTRTDNGK
ncbi:hypothetical protein HCC30_03975 [Streptomyces sp. HNM0574]|nr:hypothetical protein [Streptomyces sp. HNM0574]